MSMYFEGGQVAAVPIEGHRRRSTRRGAYGRIMLLHGMTSYDL
jgi:hypothetical protein